MYIIDIQAELMPEFFKAAAIHFSTEDMLRLSIASGDVIADTITSAKL